MHRILLTNAFLLFACISIVGCTLIGEIAYDETARKEREGCEKNISMADRQACMERANKITKQAEEARKNK